MSSGTKDLMAAFQSLTESIRSVSIGNAVKKAQEKADAIRSNQEMTEFEQIKAQQAIAKSVGASIMQYGGNAFQAQQAMASLAPEIPDARMSQLEATGEDTFAGAQQALQEDALKKQKEAEERAFDRQKQLEEIRARNAEKLARLKAESKGAPPLTKPESDKLYALLDRKTSLENLLNQFDERGGAIGTVAGRLPDITSAIPGASKLGFSSDAVAYRSEVMQDFNEYRRVVTGAAASIPELKSLRPATITEDDTPENFKAKARAILKAGELVAKARLKIAKRQGKDISGFAEEYGIDPAEDQRRDPFNVGAVPQGGTIPVGNQAPASQAPGVMNYIKFNE